MNWYKKYVMSVRNIFVSPDVYKNLEELADKIIRGQSSWTEEDLQLQQNYPEELEFFLRKKNR